MPQRDCWCLARSRLRSLVLDVRANSKRTFQKNDAGASSASQLLARSVPWRRRHFQLPPVGGRPYYWSRRDDSEPPLDPRWLDVAVELKNVSLVRQLGRPGHAGANKFLKDTFDEVLKKSKSLDDCQEVVAGMIQAAHPDAADAFVAAFQKHNRKATYYSYWFTRLIPELPKEALPKLEALLPNMSDAFADNLLGYIQQLRDKK